MPLILGAVAAVAVIVVLGIVLSRRGAEPEPQPSAATGSVAAESLAMEFVVVPWARIEKLEDLDRGRVVAVPEPTTPTLVMLPAGRYRATLATPDLSLKDSVEFSVGPSAARRVVHVMAGFDQARAFAELAP